VNYYLRAARELSHAEFSTGEWRVRYYGQEPGSHGPEGRPAALLPPQARWLGPRLAREWRCEVAAITLAAGEVAALGMAAGEVVALCMAAGEEKTVARWRYNDASGSHSQSYMRTLVETLQQWRDTSDASGGTVCAGVSSSAPASAPGSGGA
jgi:hypothetical protein